jgi:Chemotaxis phosphatase CheX
MVPSEEIEGGRVMREEDALILRGCVDESASEVFAACALPVEPDGAEPGGPASEASMLAAFIGFTSDRLLGTLTLVAPVSLMRASHPVALGASDALYQVFDWAGEIVNQILGRVKNKLVFRGLDLRASTPQTMRASHFELTSSSRMRVCSLGFRGADGQVRVQCDAVAPEDVVVFPAGAAGVECLGEGTLELF